MSEHPVEAKIAAVGLLFFSLIVWALTDGSNVGALVKLMAIVCIGAFGGGLYLMQQRPATWTRAAVSVMGVWLLLNVWFWTPAVFALEPTACAAEVTVGAMSVPKECCCQGCDDGTIPWYVCWLAGCF